MTEIRKTYYLSEIGSLEITGTAAGIRSIGFVDKFDNAVAEVPECLRSCVRQLDEYFRGTRKVFSIKFDISGSDFEMNVWRALQNIPYAQTRAYGQISKEIGHPKAFRAVGNANRKNRISIMIPCHRVIGGNGKLVGYASGLWRKTWLLAHEEKFRGT